MPWPTCAPLKNFAHSLTHLGTCLSLAGLRMSCQHISEGSASGFLCQISGPRSSLGLTLRTYTLTCFRRVSTFHHPIPAPPSLQTVVGWLQKNETTIIGVAGGFIQTQLGIIYFGDQRVPLVTLASALERADFGKNLADGEVTEV